MLIYKLPEGFLYNKKAHHMFHCTVHPIDGKREKRICLKLVEILSN